MLLKVIQGNAILFLLSVKILVNIPDSYTTKEKKIGQADETHLRTVQSMHFEICVYGFISYEIVLV